MAEQQLIGALEAGGTKMVCATGYADGTVLEREQIATTTPQEDRRGRQRMVCRQGHRRAGHRRLWPHRSQPCLAPVRQDLGDAQDGMALL
ncbi:MAG: hypothetical protein ACLTYW_11185 [Collinsella sp.]